MKNERGAVPRAARRTGAQRNAKYRAQGRQVAVVLRDERAIASLDRLADQCGGVTAAVSHALVCASSSSRGDCCTGGTVCFIGDAVTVTLHDENGNGITETGIVEEVLE